MIMTNPTLQPIDETERKLLLAFRELEAQLDPVGVVRLKEYANEFSRYRIARAAKQLWDTNNFTAARELTHYLDKNP